MNKKILDRFWDKVDKTSNPNGCWEWTAYSTQAGYGQFANWYGKTAYAHRISYEIANNAITKKDIVCHSCDNPKCVNPNHLWLGTPQQNLKDRDIKGRQAKGIQQGLSKLTETQVLDIRTKSMRAIDYAKKYRVDITNIYQIQNRETWKHI